MAASLRPQFFCTRPNGAVTPLVAVDELPAHLSIRGVSRNLSANDTQGMTSLGTVNGRNQAYVVDGIPSGPMRAAAAAAGGALAGAAANGGRSRDSDLQAALLRVLSDESIPPHQRVALHGLVQQALSQNWAAAPNNPTANNWLVPAGNGNGAGNHKHGPPSNTKKEFCSYWIRHGECDYQQQGGCYQFVQHGCQCMKVDQIIGCLYKHEMPKDPAMLEKLGLRDIPRWYREKYNVSSMIPNGNANPRSHGGNQSWRDDAADTGAVKSIQYPSRLRFNGALPTPSSSDTEKAPKQKAPSYLPTSQQNNANAVTVHSRSGYSTTLNAPRAPGLQKHGSKGASNQSGMNTPTSGKKVDLLSFDTSLDYSSFDSQHREMSGMACPASGTGPNNASNNKAPDEIRREGLVQSFQRLSPTFSDYASTPVDPNPTQQRSKRSQKPRRLYQPRSQILLPNENHQPSDQPSFKNAQHLSNAFSSATSIASKDTNGSQITSPIGLLGSSGLYSDPPTRVASPSIHSPTSLSSESSPRAFCHYGKDKGSKLLPSAIGTKRNFHKSTNFNDEDLLGLGMKSENGHGNSNRN